MDSQRGLLLSTGTNAELDDLLEELGNRLQAGEHLDLESVVAQHPQHADDLRRYFPSLQVLAGLKHTPEQLAVLGELGDFRLLHEEGRGGMGIVYEAEQISLHRRVALKVLPFAATMDARHLQRFHNEARAAASLDHPHIVRVHAIGCERGVHYFAMKFNVVRFSHRGDLVVVPDRVYGTEVRLCEAASGQSLFRLASNDDQVQSADFSPDDRILATANDSGTVRLWHARSGQMLDMLGGHTGGRVWCVTFSPDGRTLATSGKDGTVQLWDPNARQDRMVLASPPSHCCLELPDKTPSTGAQVIEESRVPATSRGFVR